MLGLSATMERKDKMTDVFKMFLGDIVYSEKRQNKDKVYVRAIRYENYDDKEFSKTELNFRGQTHYSVMIKKLCEHEYRSEFILRVIDDIMKEFDNKKQIMVLAHNKSILLYLHDKIKERNIGLGSVGYYVGGMKEKDLKETENKKIIIATYAMAEEALDIKTLSGLILATPKTDVVQAVGRILRMKHDVPLVVDIVDQHDLFQRHWDKRRRYYKKCKYTIKEINNIDYQPNTDNWKILYSEELGQQKSGYKKEKKIEMNGVCLL